MRRLRRAGIISLTLLMIITLASWAVEKEPFIPKEEIINSLQQAQIDWKMAKGEHLMVALQSESDTWEMRDRGMFKLFEEFTGIKLTYDLFEEVQLRQKTTIDLMSGTGIFDVVMMDPMYLRAFTVKNAIENLDTYLNDPKLTDKSWLDWPEDFPKGFSGMGKLDGKQYGFPMHISGQLFYYNKTYFKRYGLDPNRPPKNFQELRQYAAKLDHPSDGIYGIALRGLKGGGLNVFAWSSFLKAFGGKWVDKEWEPQLDSPEAIASIDFYAKLLQDYGPPGVTDWEWSKIMTAMTQGTIAMTQDAPTFSINIEDPKQSKTVGQWGYTPNIAGPKGIVMTPYSWYFVINSHSRVKKAAWLFITFCMSKAVQTAIGGPLICTGRVSVLENPVWEEKLGPWFPEWKEAMTENVKYADPDARLRVPEWPEIGDIMGAHLQEVIAGIKTAKEAAEAANTRIRKVLEKAGYYK